MPPTAVSGGTGGGRCREEHAPQPAARPTSRPRCSRTASARAGLSPSATMQLAQELYEGSDLPSGVAPVVHYASTADVIPAAAPTNSRASTTCSMTVYSCLRGVVTPPCCLCRGGHDHIHAHGRAADVSRGGDGDPGRRARPARAGVPAGDAAHLQVQHHLHALQLEGCARELHAIADACTPHSPPEHRQSWPP